MQKNLKYYINKALNEKFALGAFNFCNMESLQGILEACKNNSSPAIISVSESALSYMGDEFTINLAKASKNIFPYLFLHLDHGKSFETCKKAVDLGFDSVMIDGSSLSFDENINLTKKVCEYAHPFNVYVEGELGQIKGIEDNVSYSSHLYTDPNLAQKFVESTNIDMLAIAIGTSHGVYKYQREQTLRLDILEEIEKLLPNFPLVLHGASTVENDLVDEINTYGGEIKKAIGIPKELLQNVVKNHNIIKINTDTDIRLAMTSQVRKYLMSFPENFDPRKYLVEGKNKIVDVVSNKICNIFYSNNKI